MEVVEGSGTVLELWVLRHAKAAADSPDGTDHSRPLTKRGTAQAQAAARFLSDARSTGVRTARLILCSSAVRARQTAELVLPGLGTEVTLEVERDLYDADADDVLERLTRVWEDVDSVMVVGHNPCLADLAQLMVTPEDNEARHKLENFPTCALAQFSLPAGSWAEVAEGSGRLERLFTQ